MHLPKTGGTSVLAALRENLPPDAIETIAYGVAEDPDNVDLAALRNKMLLHGHFSARWAGLFDRATSIAVCFRDPLETTRSFYKYFLAHRPSELSGRQASIRRSAETGFKDYLDYWRGERASQYYVHYLDPLFIATGTHGASAVLSGRPLEKAVSRAIHFLDRCDIIGTCDDLPAFVRGILHTLGQDTGSVVVGRKNVSEELAGQSPGRFIEVPSIMDEDDETRELLLEINAPAMRIYQHAVALARDSRASSEAFATGAAGIQAQPRRDPPDSRATLDFIVCGMPRGGTTFFGQLFNVHQDVYCYFMETSLFRQLHVFGKDRPFPLENIAALEACLRAEFTGVLVEATRDERTKKFRRLINYKNLLGEHGLTEASGPGIRVWDDATVEVFIRQVVDLFRQGLHGEALFKAGANLLAEHLRGVTARPMLGEKTPDNLFFVEDLQEASPDLKAFCILREPYSTLESMKRRAMRTESFDSAFSKEVWGGIVDYYRFMRAAYDLSTRSSPATFDVYRFEDLLDDPVREMERAYRTLGLEMPDAARKILPQLRVPTDKRHTHELNLSAAEYKLIEMTLGHMLRHFGYADAIEGRGDAGDADVAKFSEGVLPLSGLYMDGELSGRIEHKWMAAKADLFLLYARNRTRIRIRMACNFPSALGLESVTLVFSSGERELARIRTSPVQEHIEVDIDLGGIEKSEASASMFGSHLRISSSSSYAPITVPGLGMDIRDFSYLIVSCDYA